MADYDKLLDNFSSLTLQTQNDVDIKYIVNDVNDLDKYAVYTHNLYIVNDSTYTYARGKFTGLMSTKLEHVLWLLQNDEPTDYDQMAFDEAERFIKNVIDGKPKLESTYPDVVNDINWLKKHIEEKKHWILYPSQKKIQDCLKSFMIAGVLHHKNYYPNLMSSTISNVDLTFARKLFLKSIYTLYNNELLTYSQLFDYVCIALGLGLESAQSISNWEILEKPRSFLERLRRVSEKFNANLLFFYKSFYIINNSLYMMKNNTSYFVGELGYNHRVIPMYRLSTEQTAINTYIHNLYSFLKDKDCESKFVDINKLEKGYNADKYIDEGYNADTLIDYSEPGRETTLMKTALYWAIHLVRDTKGGIFYPENTFVGPCFFTITPPGKISYIRKIRPHYLYIVRKVLLLFGPFGINCYEEVLSSKKFPSLETFLLILDESQLKFLILQLYPFYHEKELFVGSPSDYLQYVFPYTKFNEDKLTGSEGSKI